LLTGRGITLGSISVGSRADVIMPQKHSNLIL